ncbi:jg12736 [Pararge aegeria aegeria]|uniref:Jg12736 protein n=1 Tax=Pararge aegeria aegeria TaxID=348720 RepID=A0A8S4S7A4_9NEOP|nr:jg12736 [Pararge aegeria aegeria]
MLPLERDTKVLPEDESLRASLKDRSFLPASTLVLKNRPNTTNHDTCPFEQVLIDRKQTQTWTPLRTKATY